MDGTLVDTEPYWIASTRARRQLVGVPDAHANPSMLFDPARRHSIWSGPAATSRWDHGDRRRAARRSRSPRSAETSRGDLAHAGLSPPRRRGVPCALVTMSWKSVTDPMVPAAARLFQTVVTGDVVTSGKPHPRAYHGPPGSASTRRHASRSRTPPPVSSAEVGAVVVGVQDVVPLPAPLTVMLGPGRSGSGPSLGEWVRRHAAGGTRRTPEGAVALFRDAELDRPARDATGCGRPPHCASSHEGCAGVTAGSYGRAASSSTAAALYCSTAHLVLPRPRHREGVSTRRVRYRGSDDAAFPSQLDRTVSMARGPKPSFAGLSPFWYESDRRHVRIGIMNKPRSTRRNSSSRSPTNSSHAVVASIHEPKARVMAAMLPTRVKRDHIDTIVAFRGEQRLRRHRPRLRESSPKATAGTRGGGPPELGGLH